MLFSPSKNLLRLGSKCLLQGWTMSIRAFLSTASMKKIPLVFKSDCYTEIQCWTMNNHHCGSDSESSHSSQGEERGFRVPYRESFSELVWMISKQIIRSIPSSAHLHPINVSGRELQHSKLLPIQFDLRAQGQF